MNNIFKSTLLMLGAALMLTACSDDRDSNPTLQQPASFVLNTPAYANAGIDLAESTAINFTWSQPDYGGFPVAANYVMEFSVNNEWTISNIDAAADETGATQPNYYITDNYFSGCSGSANATELAKALQILCNYTTDAVPESQDVYVRMRAETSGAKPVYSNTVTINVKPYYIELKDAAPVLWYFVGSGIAFSDWDNSSGAVGNGLFPLLPLPGAEFDKDGLGTLTYSGFFAGGCQFKFIRDPGSWDVQMNFTNVQSPDMTIVSDLDGDNHNIGINEDGYYKVEMNTQTNKITIEKLDITPAVQAVLTMPGSYQGWDAASNEMSPMNANENHQWFADVTFDADADADGGMKFANGSWDVNWGAADYPLGIGTQGGPNIPFKAGSYRIFFNDISGIYYFVEQ